MQRVHLGVECAKVTSRCNSISTFFTDDDGDYDDDDDDEDDEDAIQKHIFTDDDVEELI